MGARITAVVVSFADPIACSRAITSLLGQSLAPLEVLVVDNDPGARNSWAQHRERDWPRVRILRPEANLGYTRAVNLAARQAEGDWLFLLNPDAVASRYCLERLLAAADRPDVGLVGAQVLLADGRVNAGDNPIAIAGISWSGGYGQPREHGPARDVAAVSGAALLARRDAFLELGGLCPYFFMYVDDADLAWRMRMRGWRVRYCPEATVVHDYEFDKGPHKWFYLERNRAWALLSNLQLRTLLFLTPLLVATELVVLGRAISQKWGREKVRAWTLLLRQMPQLLTWRQSVQESRTVSDYWVLRMFSATIETPLLDSRPPSWTAPALRCYRRVTLCLLRRSAGPEASI
jgi:GT2 family glycosyltransferase